MVDTQALRELLELALRELEIRRHRDGVVRTTQPQLELWAPAEPGGVR